MMKRRPEPVITINGVALSEGQALTVRVALEDFDSMLAENGLGEDETGRQLGYPVLSVLNDNH